MIGLGCGPLGDASLSDGEATRLVHAALDLGVRVFDTAPSYGTSEARLGRALEGRRASATVVTKGGYGVPGIADWTPEGIARGIDRALAVMGTDYLDAFLLHSCGPRDDLIAPLAEARQAGKVRAIGYAGDGDALAWAMRCDAFDVVECSVNVVDCTALDVVATGARMVLGKRSLANAPWAWTSRPPRDDAAAYWDRWQTLRYDEETIVRFAAHAPGVTTALFGTRRPERLANIVRLAAEGPLDPARADTIREAARRFPPVV